MQNKKDEINVENKELKILLNLIPELTTLTPDGIFLKQNRIAIPNELQDRALLLAYENHSGIAKMIALLREKTYFVDMEARVKAKISECMLGVAISKRPIPQPLQPSALRPYIRHTINIDFLELFLSSVKREVIKYLWGMIIKEYLSDD